MEEGMLERETVDLVGLGSGRASLDPEKGKEKKERCWKDDDHSFSRHSVSTWHKHRNTREAR